MPGIFLSHSSVDKPLVRRIAGELLLERVPAWLDQWELNVGDSIDSALVAAIQEADYVALFISRASVESGWVARELAAAMAYERQLKRVFLLPIRLDDTEVPLSIADRVYANFDASIDDGLSALLERLRRDGKDGLALDDKRVVYPILFLPDSISINYNRLARYLSWLQNAAIQSSSPDYHTVVAINTQSFQSLNESSKRVLRETVDNPVFRGADRIDEEIRSIDANRKLLQLGVEQILTKLNDSRRYDAAVAIYWFAKRVQADLLCQLHTAIPDSDPLNNVARRFLGDSYAFFKALYECTHLTKLDFWQDLSDPEGRQTKSVSALVDSRESILADCGPPRNTWRTKCDAGDSVTLGPKYLIHTQLYNFIGSRMWGRTAEPVEWDFTGWTVGLG